MNIEVFAAGALFTNCYLAYDKGFGAIIDPGGDPVEIVHYCREHGITPEIILATHGHFDHIAGVAAVKREWDIPFAISSADAVHYSNMVVQARIFGCEDVEKAPDPDIDLEGLPEIRTDRLTFEVRPTPGHSEGSVTFVSGRHLLVGDLIFQGGVGRTDLPGGDFETLVCSIRDQIFTVSNGLIYPGHGPETDVSSEKADNPFLV